ncbi:MAG: hypothetical protein ACK5HT_16425 [Draconibacterium sp.]
MKYPNQIVLTKGRRTGSFASKAPATSCPDSTIPSYYREKV